MLRCRFAAVLLALLTACVLRGCGEDKTKPGGAKTDAGKADAGKADAGKAATPWPPKTWKDLDGVWEVVWDTPLLQGPDQHVATVVLDKGEVTTFVLKSGKKPWAPVMPEEGKDCKVKKDGAKAVWYVGANSREMAFAVKNELEVKFGYPQLEGTYKMDAVKPDKKDEVTFSPGKDSPGAGVVTAKKIDAKAADLAKAPECKAELRSEMQEIWTKAKSAFLELAAPSAAAHGTDALPAAASPLTRDEPGTPASPLKRRSWPVGPNGAKLAED